MSNSPRRFIKKTLIEEEMSSKKLIPAKKTIGPKIKKEPVLEVLLEDTQEQEKIKTQLQEIYKNDDGSMPNMADFKRNRRSRLITAFFFLIFSCLFLGGIVWAGFFFIQPQENFSEKDVVLSVSGDSQITSGQEVTYRVRYRNEQSVPLAKTVLQVHYPEGFVFSSSSLVATNDTHNEWSLGSLQAHDSGYLDIYGKFYGNLGDKKSLQVFLNYFPANFSSEFQKVANLVIEVNKSSILLEVQAASEVSSGVKTDLVVTIKKTTTESVKNLALILETNKGFVKSDSLPISDVNDNYHWTIPELKEDLKFIIKGVYTQAPNTDQANLKFSIVGWENNNKKSEPFLLAEKNVETKLTKNDFTGSLTINGSVNDLRVIPGETLNNSISLKNSGQEILSDLEVELVFDTPSFQNKSMLDWKKIKDDNDGDISGEQISTSLRRGLVVWDSKKIAALKQLASGKEVFVDFSIDLKDKETIDLSSFNDFVITAYTIIKYRVGGEERTLSISPLKLIVDSDLSLETRDKVSVTNEQETHLINFIIENSFHELKNVEVGVDIYGDVEWLADKLSVPGGEAKFDPQTKKLVWKIPSMPISVDILALQFGLQLKSKNSSQTDLTSALNIKATDSITGNEINLTGNKISLQ